VSTKTTTTSIISQPSDNHEHILKLFDEPRLIGMIGDRNSGKSNMLYWLIKALRESYHFNLFYYGLRAKITNALQIFSVEELEIVHDSIVIIDEFASLFDVDDRTQKKQIENTLRLINHNNNVILLCGLPENYRKFIASKLDAMIFKQSSIGDAINGSMVKKRIINYGGDERGSAMLAMKQDEAIVYDGIHYYKATIPYVQDGDTKLKNESILKSVTKNVGKNVEKA
jgi:hypothetical protein